MNKITASIFFSVIFVGGVFGFTGKVLAEQSCGCTVQYDIDVMRADNSHYRDVFCKSKDFTFLVTGTVGSAKQTILGQINSFNSETYHDEDSGINWIGGPDLSGRCGGFPSVGSVGSGFSPPLADNSNFTEGACANLGLSIDVNSPEVRGLWVKHNFILTKCGLYAVPEDFIDRYDYQPTEFALPDASGLNRFPGATVQILLGRGLKYVLGALGTGALVMYIYAGLLWMFSGGNSDKQQKSRQILIWTSIGIVAFLLMYSVVTFILGVFN